MWVDDKKLIINEHGLPVSSGGREEERHNDGKPCQGLPTANTCGFSSTPFPAITMLSLQFKTYVYY